MKLRFKAILGAATITLGMFAPMLSANADENPLHKAIREGKPDEEIIALAEKNPKWLQEKDRPGRHGCTPAGLLPEGKEALRDKLRRIEFSSDFPMRCAVEYCDTSEIERLHRRNPSLIHTETCLGILPIFHVKNVETLALLHSLGADLDVVTADGYGVPLISYLIRKPDMVEYLLDNGANKKAIDANGWTVWHWLFSRLCHSILHEMDSDPDPDAFKVSDAFKVIEILSRDEPGRLLINSVDNKGFTPLDQLYGEYKIRRTYIDEQVKKYGPEVLNGEASTQERACCRLFEMMNVLNSKYHAKLGSYYRSCSAYFK